MANEAPDKTIGLTEALYEVLLAYQADQEMDLQQVHLSLAAFVLLVLSDAEQSLQAAGQDNMAGGVRAQFIEWLALSSCLPGDSDTDGSIRGL